MPHGLLNLIRAPRLGPWEAYTLELLCLPAAAASAILDAQSVIMVSLLSRRTKCINRWPVICGLRVRALGSGLHVIQAGLPFFFLHYGAK